MRPIPLIITVSISFNATGKNLDVDASPISITRHLTSDTNVDISSSSDFDMCSIHFRGDIFPNLSDDDYFKKKSLVPEWACLYSGKAFEIHR